MSVKLPEPAFMRIAGLIAPGDNCSIGEPACAQNRGIDFGAQNFRCQRFSGPNQPAAGTPLRPPQNFHCPSQTCFSNPKGVADFLNFLFRLCFARGPEKTVRRSASVSLVATIKRFSLLDFRVLVFMNKIIGTRA